jgi:shikimate kinase
MIIGLMGKIGSGKSTIANYLQGTHNYTEYSFADPLKKIGLILGFSHDQLYGTQEQKLAIHPHWRISGRTFMQRLGTTFRDINALIPELHTEKGIWIDLLKMKVQNCEHIVISDVRFQDEANAVKELGGIIISISRENRESKSEHSYVNHESETSLEKIVPDYVIVNNSSVEDSYTELESILALEEMYKQI